MAAKKWTKELIVAAVKELYVKGEDISPSKLSKNHRSLYRRIIRKFGDSSSMYRAANLDPNRFLKQKPDSCRKWDKELIIADLKELYAKGEDISPANLSKNHGDLYRRRKRFFNDSSSMYRAAGLDPNQFFKKKSNGYWINERILEGLKERLRNGKEMSYSALAREDKRLLAASVSRYGNFTKALEAAGIDSSVYRKVKPCIKRVEKCKPPGYWQNEENILKEIKKLYESGLDMHYQSLRERYMFPLLSASESYLGGWYKACKKAGIPEETYYTKTPKDTWTQESIIAEIKRIQKAGGDLSDAANRQNRRGPYRSVIKFYGSWSEALKASGMDPQKICRQHIIGFWTDERIIGTIKDLAQRGIPISSRYASLNYLDLHAAASKRFKGWGAAVKAAGFDYDSIRRQHKEYTKEELLAIMREHYEKGLPLDLSSFREIRGASVFGIIRKRFGTYEHAITELGLDYTKIRKDALSRAFKGVVFEKYVAEAFKILRPELRYQKSSTFEGKRSRPDFRNDMIKLWVDAKIDSWSGGVGLTARNYLKHCKRLEIIYLTGNPRVWIDDSVEFIPIADYYDQLKEIGREDFVRDFEKLRKGIFRPELQSELERFVKREIKNVS